MYTNYICLGIGFIIAFFIVNKSIIKGKKGLDRVWGIACTIFFTTIFGLLWASITSHVLLSYCIRTGNVNEDIHESLLGPLSLNLSRLSEEDKAPIYVIKYSKLGEGYLMAYTIWKDEGGEDYLYLNMVQEVRGEEFIEESDSARNGVHRTSVFTAKGTMAHFTTGSKTTTKLIVPKGSVRDVDRVVTENVEYVVPKPEVF